MHGALLDGESGEFVGRIDGLSSIALSLVILFQPFFLVKVFWSVTVTKRSLHVKTLSTSFDSIEILTKFYG